MRSAALAGTGNPNTLNILPRFCLFATASLLIAGQVSCCVSCRSDLGDSTGLGKDCSGFVGERVGVKPWRLVIFVLKVEK
jgi:hypothetical protein